MRRFILALPLLATACMQQPTMEDLAQTCLSYGYLRETPEFSQCMQIEAHAYQQRMQAAYGLMAQQGMAMQQAQALRQLQLQQAAPQNVYLHRGFGW